MTPDLCGSIKHETHPEKIFVHHLNRFLMLFLEQRFKSVNTTWEQVFSKCRLLAAGANVG